ncbi:hypothetical protein AXG93_1865s1300 [Marchantia polymorpha subsp. ruderalis]|uniref:Uncharacterized protein n=1 Tax=Marchantia polymorpha subsp. ruderalis TaxID=1480154 RepID=A0A176WIU9_MARPO|nr:hypothetical protein AXG93_1865s1300 [Marchantia polymorpha subsp. ruderalis]
MEWDSPDRAGRGRATWAGWAVLGDEGGGEGRGQGKAEEEKDGDGKGGEREGRAFLVKGGVARSFTLERVAGAVAEEEKQGGEEEEEEEEEEEGDTGWAEPTLWHFLLSLSRPTHSTRFTGFEGFAVSLSSFIPRLRTVVGRVRALASSAGCAV